MQWIVYVLKSKKDGILYSGLTTDLERRLNEHNSGKSKFTKGHKPWEVFYLEKVETRIEARKREKYFKTSAGRRFLKKVAGSPSDRMNFSAKW